MSSTIKLFTVRGIDIRLHITFPLILVWAAIQFGVLADGGLTGAVFGVIVVTLLFAIVTLHELGHSLAALHYGIPVAEIVLLPIGGVAQLERIPENPIQEFVIAIAGPAVNFAIAALMVPVGLALNIPLLRPLTGFINIGQLTFEAIFAYIFVYNIFLGLFNLLPAFPMDGGRVLRALLATRLEYTRATSIASGIGRLMAWLFGLYGFLTGSFFMILIAFFVYMGAGQEEQLVRARAILRGLKVRQAFSRAIQTLRPDNSIQDAISLTLSTLQSNFPVCDGDQLVGLLSYPQIVTTLQEHGPGRLVGEVMTANIEPAAPGDELFDVQQRFNSSNLDALPVVDNGRFLGLITSRDIAEVYRLLSISPNLLPKTAPA
jgi:Zn-dependent protease/CBS domain-containing protein